MSHHLVTGGGGFVGSALVHHLLDEGHEVTVLDRFSRGKIERIPKEAKTVKGDIRDQAAVLRAALECDTIWHLAYVQGTQTFYADPKDVIDVALRGIVNVLRVCEVCPGKELFLVSSSEVYQNPPEGMYPTDESVPLSVPDVTNPRYSYGGGKIASEIATLAYAQAGILERAVIVRPHNIYGPDMGVDHVIPQFALRMNQFVGLPPDIDQREPLPFHIQGTGLETRSFCYIDDCIDGLMCLYEKGESGEVYHLGNPREEYAISHLAHFVARWFDKSIEVVPGELPKGSPTRRKPDIFKLAALGYAPQVHLKAGLEMTLPWYADAQEKAA